MNKIIEKIVEPGKVIVGSTFLLKVKVDDSIETREAQGTNIYINDSADSRIVRLRVYGNSVQNGTPTPSSLIDIDSSGDNFNLLPNEATTQTLNGLTFTVNTDKSITINGTATANTNYTLIGQTGVATEVLRLKANQSYYNTTSLRLVYRLVNGDYGAINSGTYTPTNDLSMRHIYLSINNGTVMNNVTVYPQIVKGTKPKDYEEYGKHYINEIICNKNLFDKNNPKILNAFVNGNTGLLAAPTNNQKSIAVRLQANATYTISGVERASSNYGLFDDVTLTIGTSIATQKANITNGKRTITTGNNTKWFVFLLGGGTETYGYNNVQIEVGSTETAFIQHQEQRFIIPCQQPMRSIGNVRDEFIKQDGIWYEKHNLRQRILNGNEIWISQTQTGFYRYGLSDSVINNETSYASQIIIKSDSFKGITFNNRNSDTNETIYAVSNGQQHNLFINTRSYTTLNDFKNWLTGNNIEVLYLLNEPNYIECTQEQIEALESIIRAYTYEPITNINSTDETPAYLDLIYYKKEE